MFPPVASQNYWGGMGNPPTANSPRTGGTTSLTGLALGFWAPAYRKFSATTGATTSDAALSAALVAPLVKLNMYAL